MSFSYSGNPGSSSNDAVRYLIRDTDSARAIVQDEEIAWTLTQEMNFYMAAAKICEQFIGNARNVKTKRVGDLSIEYDVTAYKELAEKLKGRGASYIVPFAGGISIADMNLLIEDTDVPNSLFRIKMNDNRLAGAGAVSGSERTD